MNKDIRRQRTEGYFIDALCDIIRQEGMGAVTIRRVADRAGYNSATIYTYFNNLSHLLLGAHFKFEQELLQKIITDTQPQADNNICKMWSAAYISMADYYLENPNIFECIFVSMYEDAAPAELRNAHAGQSVLIRFLQEFLTKVSSATGVQLETVQQIHQSCLSLTVGTVLLNLKERVSEPKQYVLCSLTRQISCLIHGQLSNESKEVHDVN